MIRGLFVGAVAVFSMALLLDVNVQGGDKDKAPSVKEIMQGCMKSGLCKKVMSGKGDDADKEKLFKMLTQLADNKAPKGDQGNWEKLTKEICEAVKSGDTKAVAKTLNCQACHKAHK